MKKFKLQSGFKPTPDQKRAINTLVKGLKSGIEHQVLLGVTGSGKTFTIANVIEKMQRPALIISHNKTLAAQLYQEFRDFFPNSAVSYFVSYYDYYQPEAYIPSTDTYIEKDADINELIDKLRLATTSNLLTRSDTIVVASVSCIYNIGSPKEYRKFVFEFENGMKIKREEIISKLVDLQYERVDFGFHRGTFRVRGDTLDIHPSYQDEGIRIELGEKIINKITIIDPVSGTKLENNIKQKNFILYPAKHFITDPSENAKAFENIEKDMESRYKKFKKQRKLLEANRIKQKVTYDLEMIKELGYVNGIENYSRYFDGRDHGDPPFTLLDYFNDPFKNNWLVFIDESHMTFPQIRGMYAGDNSRKKTLIEYGFRLPAAIDNRPLTFEEFMRRIPNFIATSATPSKWELSMAKSAVRRQTSDFGKRITKDRILNIEDWVVEQLLRPTGIPDPEVVIRPLQNQVAEVIKEIQYTAKNKQRALVSTLTKKTAEDLSEYLKDKGMKVHYLHSDVKTLERTDTLDKLRRGEYDCIVGVNLLREGLDLPEVTLVAILDADKEGFLRSEVSLIQTMGRAARHVDGRVILYADKITGSIEKALSEVRRRREYQIKINKKYGIRPKSIKKPLREKLIESDDKQILTDIGKGKNIYRYINKINVDSLTPMEKKKLEKKLTKEMRIAAQDLNFELAVVLRDKIKELSS
jgi:excinuclease ABC subunit B